MQHVPDTLSDTPEVPDTLPETVLEVFNDVSKSYTRLEWPTITLTKQRLGQSPHRPPENRHRRAPLAKVEGLLWLLGVVFL